LSSLERNEEGVKIIPAQDYAGVDSVYIIDEAVKER
jgi:hypothetical protein